MLNVNGQFKNTVNEDKLGYVSVSFCSSKRTYWTAQCYSTQGSVVT